jgi:protein-S-isoprenylcysteine O-methyltransferase Ste14
MITTLGAYLLLALFFVFEGRLRQGSAAKSREAGEHDRSSTNFVGAAFGLSILCMLLAPLLNYFNLGRLIPPVLAWAGLVLAAGGLALRLWAPRVLGQYYTRTLRVAEQQTVVDEGPYRLIRHPGYAGVVALWIGAGLATGNVIVTLVIAALMFAAYAYRIQAEEAMLVATLGQPYRDYQARTKRLIPFIY